MRKACASEVLLGTQKPWIMTLYTPLFPDTPLPNDSLSSEQSCLFFSTEAEMAARFKPKPLLHFPTGALK